MTLERQSEEDQFGELLLEFCEKLGYQIQDNILLVGITKQKTKITESIEGK